MILMQNFSVFLYKIICCWYSFELPQLVKAIQMSTNNIQSYVVGIHLNCLKNSNEYQQHTIS